MFKILKKKPHPLVRDGVSRFIPIFPTEVGMLN